MPSTYTSRLRFTLPATGELTNVWGNTVNSGITELVESSIAGAATLSTWGGAGVAYTLSNNNGAADEARCMFLVASGTPGENKNIICPAVTKLYVVRNNVSGGFSVTLKTSAGTGITVPNGTTMFLRCDGTDVVDALTRASSLSLGTALTVANGGTGATTLTANTVLLGNGTSTLQAVAPGASGNLLTSDGTTWTSAAPAAPVAGGSNTQVQYNNAGALAGSANLTFNGTTLTANALTVSTGNLTFSGTAQRITGDFSNATASNRVLFQTSTANGSTSISALPNGTGVSASFSALSSSDANNASFGSIRANTSTGLVEIISNAAGTGSLLPMAFSVGGSEQLRILTTGGITSANLADAVGYKGTPLNEQSTAYTLVIGDQGKSIVHPISDNNARTFTIPANGSVAYPVGTTITFINMINTLTIAITTDTMYLAGAGTTGSRTLAAYGMATAVKLTSTTWIISGNGLT
jgi:hypothetical protein